MAGHSKWANIKRRKGAQDAKRGKLFSKLAKAIIIAAKNGGDPNANLALKYAIDKAKQGNMPNDTIANAIKKGTGELEGMTYENLLYEGFAPGGVALIVEALSDKRTRTTPEMRKIFSSRGGNLGEQNSVSFMFNYQGVIVINREGIDGDELMEAALEVGAEDFDDEDETVFVVKTASTEMHAVIKGLEAANYKIESADLMWLPTTLVDPSEEDREKLERLIDALEDHDDVQNVFSNLQG